MGFVSTDVRRSVVAWGCVFFALTLVACAANPSAKRTRRAMSEEEELEIGKEAAAQVAAAMGFAGSEVGFKPWTASGVSQTQWAFLCSTFA